VDLELAKAKAEKVEDDEELMKKLWLKVAKCRIKSHRRGLNMGLLFQALKKTKNLSLSTSVAHSKKVLPYY
jgi:hypothetical protein